MRSMDLNGIWESVNGRTGERYRANVPGFIQKDLMEQGVIPNEYDTLLEPKIEWIENDDWEYRRTFGLDDELLRSEALELVFEGVDTFAEIQLNGKVVGRTENMFLSYRFDVKGIAQANNELVVRIFSPTETMKEKERAFGESLIQWNSISARVFGRKAQYGYGWDWGARLATVGIHKAVRVEGRQALRGEHLGYRLAGLSDEKAIVVAHHTVVNLKDAPFDADMIYRIYDGETLRAEKKERTAIAAGQRRYEASLEIANPKLWYPAGHGDQPLYRLEVSVVADEASISSSCAVGIRDVKIKMPYDEQGRKFLIEVNGAAILCKGVNWIPLRLFPNLDTAEEYRSEIADIAAANMNMIRVWGGGTYENHDFYEECDRLGIMVWQDFMFACGDYPDDDAFSELVRREADFVIDEFGWHPSIVLWCGNNENQYFVERSRKFRKHGFGEKLYFDVLKEACRKDTLRPYWPTSPYSLTFDHSKYEGDYGDLHSWHVWGQTHPYEEYRDVNGRFLSEFGMQSYPSMRVMDQVDPAANLRDPKFDAMQKAPYGIQRLFYYTVGDYLLPADKAGFVYVSQLMQANALRYGVEHWVSRMPDTSGALIWQWSDLWPSISWAIVDYAKVKKPAYYYMKRSFRSPNVIAKTWPGRTEAELYVVHDLGDIEGKVTAEFYDLTTDRVVKTEEREIRGQGRRSTFAGKLEVSGFDPATTVLYVHLEAEGDRLASQTYLLGKPHRLKLKPANVQVTKRALPGGDTEFTLTADAFAKDVGLSDVPGTLSDNYFDLRAGESRTVVLQGPLPEDCEPTVVCLNGIRTISYV
ncbi:beta-mannosidase [Cohnella zeiphila]|uniref:Beta-mannosidase B n=1 Tax=Cohnella zeiphila TaxID=2761120 RepID=A0A7X0SRX1_9BACL|nr:glycoside hydrolase family 2 protein [Cohnella zeiphila]MBB6735028.1 glycoside hydrolase family 2 protein [Cohnella zeiphila]